jgi:hypothetical protein
MIVSAFSIFLKAFHFLLKIIEGLILRVLLLIQIFVYKFLYYPMYPLLFLSRKLFCCLKFLRRYFPLMYRDDISFSNFDKEYIYLKEQFFSQRDRYIKFSGDFRTIFSDLMKFKNSIILFEYQESYIGVVKHENIVGTHHPNYSCYYDKNETGKFDLNLEYFPGKRGDPGEGYKKAWYPQNDSWNNSPSLIQLEKHPTCENYFVGGDGNHRVMSSKIKDDAPPYVYANIAKLKWKLEGILIFFLCSFEFFDYNIEIIRPDFGYNSFVYFSFKEIPSSSRIYIKITIDHNGVIYLDEDEIYHKIRFASLFKTKLKHFPNPNWWVKSLFLNTEGEFPKNLKTDII